jgi:aspartyl/asparaginyl beta-hydroxylase (cupin superfamily)
LTGTFSDNPPRIIKAAVEAVVYKSPMSTWSSTMFYDASLFDFAQCFEENWADIQNEYKNLDNTILDIARTGSHAEYVEKRRQQGSPSGWSPSWQVGSQEKNLNWLTYGLCYQGRSPQYADEKFPITKELLNRFPCIQVAAFSKMQPLSCIAPHRHPELGGNLLTYHLGIDVEPRASFLYVDKIFQEQAEKKSIIFDGSYEHFAINVSLQSRTVLYVEFDRSKM